MRIAATVFVLSVSFAATTSWADKATIFVHFDDNKCPKYTLTDENNCSPDPHEIDKSCRSTKFPSRKVRWEVAKENIGKEIDVVFRTDNPFESCKFKSSGGKIATCKIAKNAAAKSYKYDIEAENCDPLDPRIIVRH